MRFGKKKFVYPLEPNASITQLWFNKINSCKILNAVYSSIVVVFPCQEYQQIVDAEWDILYDKLDKIVKSGAKVVLSKLPIGDVATQYFADR